MKEKIMLELDPTQATMVVLLFMGFNASQKGELIQALGCRAETVEMMHDHPESTMDLGRKVELLHKVAGCGRDCKHKKEGASGNVS